jgi:hypothetical protein
MSDDKPANGDKPVVTTDEAGKPLGPIRRGNPDESPPIKDRVSDVR